MTTFTVRNVERRTKPGMMPSLYLDHMPHGTPAQEGWYAEVVTDETEIQFSKLDGETEWVADAAFNRSCSMPTFMHGFGSRCTLLKTANDEVAAALDAATEGKVS